MTTPSLLRPISYWFDRVAKNKGSFAESYDHPFLLFEPYAESPVAVETLSGGDKLVETMRTAAPVRKRLGSNAFASMITLGRAQNNDIEVNGLGISKFHAYFTELGGQHFLTDAGSRNGTHVNKQRLEARTRRELSSGDSLLFGAIPATFLAPADFAARVEILALSLLDRAPTP